MSLDGISFLRLAGQVASPHKIWQAGFCLWEATHLLPKDMTGHYAQPAGRFCPCGATHLLPKDTRGRYSGLISSFLSLGDVVVHSQRHYKPLRTAGRPRFVPGSRSLASQGQTPNTTFNKTHSNVTQGESVHTDSPCLWLSILFLTIFVQDSSYRSGQREQCDNVRKYHQLIEQI